MNIYHHPDHSISKSKSILKLNQQKNNQTHFWIMRSSRAYTPTRTGEVTEILDKLLKELTPRHTQYANNSRDQSVSPIRENSVHLKQIELQKQSIEILQQQVREKSIENEQLKQKHMIKQYSATSNKFNQNSFQEQRNSSFLDTSISNATHKPSKMGHDNNLYDDFSDNINQCLGTPTQMELDIEQKTIQNLLNQNKMLEEKNAKFKELIKVMENQFNNKIQSYQQKEQKLDSKCRFLYQTLEGKDKEIKEIILIQQNVMQKTLKELDDKYKREILMMKEEVIRYKEELAQRDLQLQEKMYEILAKEDTITQLKVKYLENLKQNISNNTKLCFNEVRQSLEDLSFRKNSFYQNEEKQQSSQANIQQNENSKSISQEPKTIENEDKQQSSVLQQQQDQKQNMIEFNTDMTFQLDVSSQQNQQQQLQSQILVEDEVKQDSLNNVNPLQEISNNNHNTDQKEHIKQNSIKSDSIQEKNSDKENNSNHPEQVLQGEENAYDKVLQDFVQDNQKVDLSKSTQAFDKIQRSMNQMKNVQTFLKMSQTPSSKSSKESVQNGFNNSLDLKNIIHQSQHKQQFQESQQQQAYQQQQLSQQQKSYQHQQSQQQQQQQYIHQQSQQQPQLLSQQLQRDIKEPLKQMQSQQEQSGDSFLRNSINIIRQNYKDLSIKINLDKSPQVKQQQQQQRDANRSSSDFHIQKSRTPDNALAKKSVHQKYIMDSTERKIYNYKYLNEQSLQESIHSQNIQDIADKYLHINQLENNHHKHHLNQNYFNQSNQYMNHTFNDANYFCNQNIQSTINSSANSNKSHSKLYTLKLEQSQSWRDTYSNLYGKTPVNKSKQKQQQQQQSNID